MTKDRRARVSFASMSAPRTLASLVSLLALAVGCAPPAQIPSPPVPPPTPPSEVGTLSIAKFVEVDRANEWTAANCKVLGDGFAAYADSVPYTPAMHYNLGIVRERCADRPGAMDVYRAILTKDATFYPARVRLALIAYATAKAPDLDAAIAELETAVRDSGYRSIDALTELARLQMQRDREGDHALVRDNLKRALAVDDGNMSALNLLAILYLDDANGLAAADKKPALELALLVTSQAMRKNDAYAPIHNTAGLVYAAMGDSTNAADQFERARTLDPDFFEAHMNFGELNLGFRGFRKAEPAFRRAIALRPSDYDAHLGLALALSGQLSAERFDETFHEAKAELERAIYLDPKRPEAFFNEAELEMNYGGKLAGDEALGALERAKSRYLAFVDAARGNPAFADKVEDVTARATKPDEQCMGEAARSDRACKKGRLQSIDEIQQFNRSHP